YVAVSRLTTALLMVVAALITLVLDSAKGTFELLMSIGAGTGLLYLLRWFWWRINPYSEIAAMVVSFGVACWAHFWAPAAMASWVKLLVGVGVTTLAWMIVTLITPADAPATLRSFYRLVRPGGPGWKAVLDAAAADGDPIPDAGPSAGIGTGIVCMFAGCIAVYSSLLATGFGLYGESTKATILGVIAAIGFAVIAVLWRSLDEDEGPATPSTQNPG
ncbi:MAG: hypothetical protein KF861_09225, partial [Planctomycetaceae bacterium]|nr:hypothetical protein [Planctomycetaceae bacterium]